MESQNARAAKAVANAPLDSVDGEKKGVYFNRQNHVDDGGFTEMNGDNDTAVLMNGYLSRNGTAPAKDSGNGTLKVGGIGARANGIENRTGYPGPPPQPPPPQNGQGPKTMQ